jgi:DNA-binding PadR family transcriptional regulator
MAKTSKSKFAVLGILTIKPSSGYDIKKFTENNLGHFWSESYGNLYSLLKRMLDQGLVTKKTERQDGKPDRIEYSITGKGESEFEEWLTMPFEPEVIRSELLLKVFFGGRMPTDRLEKHLVTYRHQQQALDSELARVEMALDELKNDPNYPYWMMTLRRGRILCEARIRWVDESLSMMKGKHPDHEPEEVQ